VRISIIGWNGFLSVLLATNWASLSVFFFSHLFGRWCRVMMSMMPCWIRQMLGTTITSSMWFNFLASFHFRPCGYLNCHTFVFEELYICYSWKFPQISSRVQLKWINSEGSPFSLFFFFLAYVMENSSGKFLFKS